MSHTTDILLTTAQVARRLQLSERTVREYAQRGRIRSLLVGDRRRFRASAVEAFLEECETAAQRQVAHAGGG